MARDYFEEYLVAIKPDVDPALWNKATGNIRSTIEKTLFKPLTDKADELRSQIARLKAAKQRTTDKSDKAELDKQIKALTESLGATEKQIQAVEKGFAAAGAGIAAFVAVVKMAVETAQKVIDQAEEISNQFVSQSSIKVDRGVRDIMGKFGVDSGTAVAISSSAEILGYDINEYSKWTIAQRNAFASLMEEYQTGINKINPEKLEKFNQATQEYQLMVAKFQMRFKVALTSLLANSEGLTNVMNTLGRAMDSVATLLESEAVQQGFDLVMGIIDGILSFVTAPLNWLGSMFGGSTTTTNKSVNITNNVSSTTSVDAGQLAVDIGLSVRNAMSN